MRTQNTNMVLSEFRIGNWMQRNGKEFQLTVADLIEILQSTDPGNWPKPIPLNTQWLTHFDFKNDQKRDKKHDIDGLWIKDGVTIYESAWDGEFNYGTYVKGDGSFKGGFAVDTVHQLQNIFSSFRDGKVQLKIERYY